MASIYKRGSVWWIKFLGWSKMSCRPRISIKPDLSDGRSGCAQAALPSHPGADSASLDTGDGARMSDWDSNILACPGNRQLQCVLMASNEPTDGSAIGDSRRRDPFRRHWD